MRVVTQKLLLIGRRVRARAFARLPISLVRYDFARLPLEPATHLIIIYTELANVVVGCQGPEGVSSINSLPNTPL